MIELVLVISIFVTTALGAAMISELRKSAAPSVVTARERRRSNAGAGAG
ncbi:MAG: hypothetical protein O3A21_04075 [Proteobacteria bacterium]|nr:hypothetical protein [Pseudomonadota bacterium]